MSSLSAEFQVHLYADPQPGQTANESMMAISFELLAERLQKLERMYFEMDGSFVWTSATPLPWQLDGMVYDCGQHVQRIELKGQCPKIEWDFLLKAIGHPEQPLIAYDLQAKKFSNMQQLESSLWSI